MTEFTQNQSAQDQSATKLPTVTVVVPVHNGVDLLRRCLQALAAQTYPADLVDVLVVDNNSTESVASAMPDDARFTLLSETRKGSYAARNKALAQATGEVIAFTDADCRPHPDWLEQGVSELSREPRAAMIGGTVRLVFEHGQARTGCEIYEAQHSFRQDWYLERNRFAATANVITWRSTIEEVGAFDATLQSRGDAQWGQRVAASGGRQRFAAHAVVDHPARASLRELLTKQLRVARGHRDVDLVNDPRIRHFGGVATSHLKTTFTTPVTIWNAPPTPDRIRTLRYLGVFCAVRAIWITVFAGGAVRVARGRTANPTAQEV